MSISYPQCYGIQKADHPFLQRKQNHTIDQDIIDYSVIIQGGCNMRDPRYKRIANEEKRACGVCDDFAVSWILLQCNVTYSQ